MAVHVYRVTVRGRFQDLDDTTIAELVADADAHDHLHAAFTQDGTLTYDMRTGFFSLRYELRTDDEVDTDAFELGELRAADELRRAGLTHGKLRVTATDMADLWVDRD
jgi:hypothetical protein